MKHLIRTGHFCPSADAISVKGLDSFPILKGFGAHGHNKLPVIQDFPSALVPGSLQRIDSTDAQYGSHFTKFLSHPFFLNYRDESKVCENLKAQK